LAVFFGERLDWKEYVGFGKNAELGESGNGTVAFANSVSALGMVDVEEGNKGGSDKKSSNSHG
jgi:hypothetical protein